MQKFPANSLTTIVLPKSMPLTIEESIKLKILKAKISRLGNQIDDLNSPTQWEGVKKEVQRDRAKQALIFQRLRLRHEVSLIRLRGCDRRTANVKALINGLFKTFHP